MRISEIINEAVTANDLEQIERNLNRVWDEDDVEFKMHKTGNEAGGESHFLQRANDTRNRPPIQADEIEDLFKTAHDFKTPRNKLKTMPPGSEAVLTDPQTKVNVPVIAKTDPRDGDTQIIPKTIMRKQNFLTGTPVISLPFANQRKPSVRPPDTPIQPERSPTPGKPNPP